MVELKSTRKKAGASDPARLDGIFRALSDRTRRDMLRSLSQRDHSVGELAAPFHMSLAAASKHIKVLERAGLVRREIWGRTHVCRLAADPLADVQRWLAFYEQFWTARLDALEALLKADDTPVARRARSRKPEGRA